MSSKSSAAISAKDRKFLMSERHRNYQEDATRTWTGDRKIRVFFKPGSVLTDGKVVFLDPISLADTLPKIGLKGHITITMGQNGHETGHLKYTNFRALERAQKVCEKDPTIYPKILQVLNNILEDAAIELAMANDPDFPGVYAYIDYLNRQVFSQEKPLDEWTGGKVELAIRAIGLITIMGRLKGEILDEDVKNVVEAVIPVIAKARTAPTSFDRLDCAIEMYDIMRPFILAELGERKPPEKSETGEMTPEADPLPGMGGGGAGGEIVVMGKRAHGAKTGSERPAPMPEVGKDPVTYFAKRAKEEDAGKSKSKEESEEDSDKDGDGSSGSGDSPAEDGKAPGDDDSAPPPPRVEMLPDAGEDDDDVDIPDLADDIEKLIHTYETKGDPSESDGDLPGRPVYPEGVDYGETHRGIRISVIKNIESDEAIYNKILATLTPLVSTFVSLLKKVIRRRNEDVLGGMDSGELDTDDLYLARTPDKCIFQQTKKRGRNAQLSIAFLGDESGSMGSHGRIALVMAAAIMFERVCSLLGIPIAILGHDVGSGSTRIREYLPFGQTSKRARIASMRAYCDNRDGLAIRWAGEYLAKNASTPDKVLIVVSDGLPQDGTDAYSGSRGKGDTAHQIAYVETKLGIPVIGVGFSKDGMAIRSMYRHFVGVEEINTLPVRMVNILRKLLKKAA